MSKPELAATAFRIAAMLPRADVRDRLIGADSIAALTRKARGSAPPARAAPRS
jgi:hydroxymethylbilane synthase